MRTATSVRTRLSKAYELLILGLIFAGVMTAWAWAEHRILDAIEQVVPEVDAARVGVVGCSRYGKTALAAAIFDERVSVHKYNGLLYSSDVS